MRMRTMTRILLAAVASGLLLGAGTGAAEARTNIAVGIGDQSPAMFDSSLYKALKLKKTRYFIPWNAIHNKTDLERADAFVKRARTSKVKVLMHIANRQLRVEEGEVAVRVRLQEGHQAARLAATSGSA